MKRKVSLLLTVMLLGMSLAACGSKIGAENAEGSAIAGENTEGVVESVETVVEPPSTEPYVSETIVPVTGEVRDADILTAKVVDIDVNTNTLQCYYGTENTLYTDLKGNLEELCTFNSPIKKLVSCGTTQLIVQNEDDTYSIYVRKEETNEETGEVNYSYFEIVSGFAYKPMWLAYTSDYTVMSFWYEKDGEFYLGEFASFDGVLPLPEVGATPLTGCSDGTIGSEELKDIFVSDRDMLLLYENGQAFKDCKMKQENGVVQWYQDKAFYPRNAEGVENCIVEGSSAYYGYPFFKATGDNENIYAYGVLFMGVSDGSKICMPMPKGYTTEDIVNVKAYKEALVEFADGSIYIAENAGLDNMVLKMHEELTALNQERRIIDIEMLPSRVVLHLTDGSAYWLELETE